jgi:uncharacterized RDD family membrane protein YckC
MESILDSPTSLENSHSGYAGFWLRVVASFIDGLVLSIPNWIVLGSLGFTQMTDPSLIMASIGPIVAGLFVIQWLYCALMESSSKQATLGKMALGLKVTDLNGERISFGKATGRFFGKFLSYMILYIGVIMVAFTQKKQGLHDMLANTLVVKK